MKALKKSIYFGLVVLVMVYLFLPFTAHAESIYGNAYLTVNQAAASSQIELGKEYGVRLAIYEEPTIGFYFNNITEINLYKLEDLASLPKKVIYTTAISSPPTDVKQRFENSSAVMESDSNVQNIKIYAEIKYLYAPSQIITSQEKTFTTNPTPYSVKIISSGITPGTGDDSGITPGPGNDSDITPNPNPQSNISSGSLSDFIFGSAACDLATQITYDNVVSCYESKIIRLLITIASIGSIFMIILGGIFLTTSGGDPKKISKGKLAITSAIIGLVIVLLSYSILVFVQGKLTGAEVSNSTTNDNSDITPNNNPDNTTTNPYDNAITNPTNPNNNVDLNPPNITSLTPNSGVVGTSVTITGINFGSGPALSVVKFNGVVATITRQSDIEIVTTVPMGATTGSVTITTAAGTSYGTTFTVTNLFNPNPVGTILP